MELFLGDAGETDFDTLATFFTHNLSRVVAGFF